MRTSLCQMSRSISLSFTPFWPWRPRWLTSGTIRHTLGILRSSSHMSTPRYMEILEVLLLSYRSWFYVNKIYGLSRSRWPEGRNEKALESQIAGILLARLDCYMPALHGPAHSTHNQHRNGLWLVDETSSVRRSSCSPSKFDYIRTVSTGGNSVSHGHNELGSASMAAAGHFLRACEQATSVNDAKVQLHKLTVSMISEQSLSWLSFMK